MRSLPRGDTMMPMQVASTRFIVNTRNQPVYSDIHSLMLENNASAESPAAMVKITPAKIKPAEMKKTDG